MWRRICGVARVGKSLLVMLRRKHVWICGTKLRIRHAKADGELMIQGFEWLGGADRLRAEHDYVARESATRLRGVVHRREEGGSEIRKQRRWR
jgi:hypothetical protein